MPNTDSLGNLRARALSFIAVVFACLSVFYSDAVFSAPVLRAVGDNWCPYNCPPDARQRGYMIDLLERALGKDYTIVYTIEPWTRAVQLVEQGEMDLLIATPISSCLLYTSPSPRDRQKSRMPSSA